jgi:hypothetical protein
VDCAVDPRFGEKSERGDPFDIVAGDRLVQHAADRAGQLGVDWQVGYAYRLASGSAVPGD